MDVSVVIAVPTRVAEFLVHLQQEFARERTVFSGIRDGDYRALTALSAARYSCEFLLHLPPESARLIAPGMPTTFCRRCGQKVVVPVESAASVSSA